MITSSKLVLVITYLICIFEVPVYGYKCECAPNDYIHINSWIPLKIQHKPLLGHSYLMPEVHQSAGLSQYANQKNIESFSNNLYSYKSNNKISELKTKKEDYKSQEIKQDLSPKISLSTFFYQSNEDEQDKKSKDKKIEPEFYENLKFGKVGEPYYKLYDNKKSEKEIDNYFKNIQDDKSQEVYFKIFEDKKYKKPENNPKITYSKVDKSLDDFFNSGNKELEELLSNQKKSTSSQEPIYKKSSEISKSENSSPIYFVRKDSYKNDNQKGEENSEGYKDNYDHHHDKNVYYKFEYSVNDKKTKDIKHQKEERKGDKVEGEYSLQEDNGNVRTVKYVADWKNGFRADVINSKKY